jgi:hypothetical protein
MKVLAAGSLLLVTCALVQGSIIFTTGNNPQPPPNTDVNVLLNTGTSGTTVTGTLNQNSNVFVDFTSTQTLLEPSNGQARVSASPEGTPLTNLTIALENRLTYGDLIINPFIGGQCSGCVLGGPETITVNAVDAQGHPEAPATFTGTVGNGNNFLTIVATDGEQIVSTEISTPDGINDLRQPRISGPFILPGGGVNTTVPEPLTNAMVGIGLLAVAIGGNRLRHSSKRES